MYADVAVVRVKNGFRAHAAIKTTDNHRVRVLGTGHLLGMDSAKPLARGVAVKKIAVAVQQAAHTVVREIVFHSYILTI